MFGSKRGREVGSHLLRFRVVMRTTAGKETGFQAQSERRGSNPVLAPVPSAVPHATTDGLESGGPQRPIHAPHLIVGQRHGPPYCCPRPESCCCCSSAAAVFGPGRIGRRHHFAVRSLPAVGSLIRPILRKFSTTAISSVSSEQVRQRRVTLADPDDEFEPQRRASRSE